MRCLQCSAQMRKTRENFKYAASGLPGVTLMNVEVNRCPGCGEFEVSIPYIEQLHKLIASELIKKPAPFTAVEVVFLRKYLGWSGIDFAKRIGVAPETVSRWERGKDQMTAPADRALRLMVATRKPETVYELDFFTKIASVKPEDMRFGLKASSKDWHLAPV